MLLWAVRSVLGGMPPRTTFACLPPAHRAVPPPPGAAAEGWRLVLVEDRG